MSSKLGDEAIYEVRVLGRLDESWSDWLNDVTLAYEGEEDGFGITVLTGHLDQAALRGLLTRLWDLNLTVVSVGLRDGTPDPNYAAMLTNTTQAPGADAGNNPVDVQLEQSVTDPARSYSSSASTPALEITNHAAPTRTRGSHSARATETLTGN